MTEVAICIKATLESINGSKHVYPATFADIGHYLVAYEKQTGKADAVQIDSVGSFANRIEAELAALDILPVITTTAAGREISIHEMPHRAYDAILRDSLLDATPWRQSAIGRAILGSTTANATALYTYAPLTLLLGGWDSHGGDAGSGAKIARSVACEIWGYGVQTARHCVQRIDPLKITRESDKHSIVDGILTPDPNGKKPSELGHGDVPNSSEKGVFVERMEMNGAISLTRLSRYHFPTEQGDIRPERDAAARTVLVELALLGIARVLDRLDLRSGCELFTASREVFTVTADGTKLPKSLPTSTEAFSAAIAEAERQGLRFAAEPVRLAAGDALERLAAHGGV